MKTKTKASAKTGPTKRLVCDGWFGALRQCATKVERTHKRGTWDDCPGRVVCSFVARGYRVPLCERCARNVRRGDYGTRLRDLISEQVPNPEAMARKIKKMKRKSALLYGCDYNRG